MYCRWRKKYNGLMPYEMKRLVTDLSLDKEMLQEMVRKKPV